MSWNKMMKDANNASALDSSQFDFVVGEVIKMTNSLSGRERIVNLRRMVEGVINDAVPVEELLRELESLELAQVDSATQAQAAVKKFPDKEFLTQAVEIFLSLADHFGDMADLAQGNQHQLMLGTMATIEAEVAELDQAIAANS